MWPSWREKLFKHWSLWSSDVSLSETRVSAAHKDAASSSPEHKLGVFGLPGSRLPWDDDGLAHLQDLHVPVRLIGWGKQHRQEATVRLNSPLPQGHKPDPNNQADIKLQNFYFSLHTLSNKGDESVRVMMEATVMFRGLWEIWALTATWWTDRTLQKEIFNEHAKETILVFAVFMWYEKHRISKDFFKLRLGSLYL